MSWRTDVSEGLSVVALMACAATAYLSYNWSKPMVLIYDRENIVGQIGPYVQAGLDPMKVIDQAIEEAVDQGFFVIGSDQNLKGPETANFELSRFVAVPVGASND